MMLRPIKIPASGWTDPTQNRVMRQLESGINDLITAVSTASDVAFATVERPHSEQFLIEFAEDTTYPFINSGFAWTIDSVTTRCGTGSCVVSIEIDGVSLGGGANAVSTGEVTQSHTTLNSVAIGQDITIRVSSNAAAEKVSVTLIGRRLETLSETLPVWDDLPLIVPSDSADQVFGRHNNAFVRFPRNSLTFRMTPEDYGAAGDGIVDDRIPLATVDSATGPIILRQTYRVDSNLTLASELVFQGGILKPASGVTITLSGTIQAGRSKIFDLSLGGLVAISNAEELTPDWWGALSDGTTDDAAAIAACLAAAPSNGIIRFGSGDYYTTATLVIDKQVSISGAGMWATFISSPAVTAFDIAPSLNEVQIKDLAIYNTGTVRAAGSYGVTNQSTSLANGIGYLVLDNVWFGSWDHAMHLSYHQLGMVHNCRALGCNRGVYSYYGINNSIQNNEFEANEEWGIYLDGNSGGVSFSAGTLMNGNKLVNNGASGGGNFYSQYNEHFSLSDNMIDVPAAGSVSNVLCVGVVRAEICGNWIGASFGPNVRLDACSDMVVTGNNIVSATTYGLELEDCATGTHTSNVFTASGAQDIYIHGTSLHNIVSMNNMGSTGSANSIEEVGACLTNAIGNIGNGNYVFDAASTSLGNVTY